MNHIVLYTVALVVILVWIGARRNPIMALVEIGKEMLQSYKFLLLMVGMFGVLVLNKYELQIEEKNASYLRLYIICIWTRGAFCPSCSGYIL